MKSRVAAGVVAVVVAVGLAGCSRAAPKPSPTPTPPFASADAVYKAAEATYRAYVDALNKVDLADEKTFTPVYGWLLNPALDSNKKSFTQMASRHFRVGGESIVTLARPLPDGTADKRWGDVAIAA